MLPHCDSCQVWTFQKKIASKRKSFRARQQEQMGLFPLKLRYFSEKPLVAEGKKRVLLARRRVYRRARRRQSNYLRRKLSKDLQDERERRAKKRKKKKKTGKYSEKRRIYAENLEVRGAGLFLGGYLVNAAILLPSAYFLLEPVDWTQSPLWTLVPVVGPFVLLLNIEHGSLQLLMLVSGLMQVVGGIMYLIGGALYRQEMRKKDAPLLGMVEDVRVSPWVGLQSGGLSVSGRF